MENKVIYFAEFGETVSTNETKIEFHLPEISKSSILGIREKLIAELDLIIYCKNPKETLFDVFKKHHYIEAAGGVVKRKKDFLVIERLGIWDLPKGKIEIGENPKKAAIREIREECGIKNTCIKKKIGVTYHTYIYKEKLTLKKTFWFLLSYEGSKKLTPQVEEDITAAKWVSDKEFKQMKSKTYRSLKEIFVLARKM